MCECLGIIMQIVRLKKSSLLNLVFVFQLTFFLIYLNANIINAGEMGTALTLLAAYVLLSVLLFFTLILQSKLYVRTHFFIFLFFIIWISMRVIIDIGDIGYLKQITIATTGGMLLFYLLGA